MALSLESAGKVRQKTRMYTLDPSIFYALKGFFLYWSTNKSNADLQIVPFSDTDVTTAGGFDTGVDAACQVNVVYVKKKSNATAAVLKLYDNITGDSISTEQTLSVLLDESDQNAILIYPSGFSHATGLIIVAHTTVEGTSDTSAGDAGDGFVIISAA